MNRAPHPAVQLDGSPDLLSFDHPLVRALDHLTLAADSLHRTAEAISVVTTQSTDWDRLRTNFYRASKHYAMAIALLLENTVPGIDDAFPTPDVRDVEITDQGEIIPLVVPTEGGAA